MRSSRLWVIVALLVVVVAVVWIFSDNNKSEQVEVSVCTLEAAKASLESEWGVQGYTSSITGEHVVLTKWFFDNIDGQVSGWESHFFTCTTSLEGVMNTCECQEVRAESENAHEKVVHYLDNNERYERYNDGQLVRTDTRLKSDRWRTTYTALNLVNQESYNWKTPGQKDVYVTPVECTEGFAKYVPIWADDSVWTRWKVSSDLCRGDHCWEHAMIAGHVTMKSPTRHPSDSETYYMMRFNAQGVIDPDGIMKAVSAETYKRYVRFMSGETEAWSLAVDQDRLVRSGFFVGPIRVAKAKRVPFTTIFGRRNPKRSEVPDMAPFDPEFTQLGPLS